MIENIVVSKIGSESEDRKTFTSTHQWSKNGANLMVYLNNAIKERDSDYTIIDENTLEFSSSLRNSDEVKFVITNFEDPSNYKKIDDRIYELDRLSKKSNGKVQTSIEKRSDEESFVSQNITTASQIWIDEIDSDPKQAEEDGVVRYIDELRLYEDVTVPNRLGWFASEDELLENRILEWVDPRFGYRYHVRLFDGDKKEIPSSDPINWQWDYYAGYLTIHNSDHEYPLPFYISGYKFIGEKALDQLATWKEPVFSTQFLPLYHNDDGDIRLVLTENVFYRFDAIANMWRPLNYGSDTLKNPVTKINNLPEVNNQRGDLRLVLEDNDLYVWDDVNEEWILLTGQSFSPENYYTKSVLDQFLSSKAAAAHTHDSLYYRQTQVDSFIRWRPSRASYSDLPPYTENQDGDVILTRDTNTIYRWVTEDPNEGQGHWTAIVESNFTWKGPVDVVDNLPLGSNNPGDVRLVRKEEKPYWWDGTEWRELKTTVSDHEHDIYIREDEFYWKPPVNSFEELPRLDNENGDTRLVLDNNYIYRWNAHNYRWDLVSQESHWKDPVNNISTLPVSDNEDGDMIFVKETSKIYYWDINNNVWNPIENKDHDHHDWYYKKEQINALFNPQSGHSHDGVYSKAVDYNNLLNIPYFHWGTPVLDYSNLPTQGDKPGDARIVLSDRALYVWSGTEWYLIATGKFVMEHEHDDRYYTQDNIDSIINSQISSINAQLAGKASQVHDHDDRYYTQNDVDNRFDTSSGHSHNGSNSRKINFDDLNGIPDFSNNHVHNQYYTKTELQTPGSSGVHFDNIIDMPGFTSEWKSPVQTLSDLPEENNNAGDIRIVLDDKQLYEWDGNQWNYTGNWEIGSTSHWKDPIDKEVNLPLSNNIDGDIRLVLESNTLYRWNGVNQQWYAISSQDGSSGGYGGATILSGNMARETVVLNEGQIDVPINSRYNPGSGDMLVWWNGILQEVNEDYFEIDNYNIRLVEGAREEDVIFTLIFLTENVGDLYVREDHIAEDGQKIFQLDNSYTPEQDHILVYYNGQLQRVNEDYYELDITRIEMIDPCIAGEKLTFMSFNATLFAGGDFGGAIQDSCGLRLGVPPDGKWGDGLFDWTSETPSCKAFDDINEALINLVTNRPTNLDKTELIGVEERFTGFISDGNANIEDNVGVEKEYLTTDGEFYLYTANNSMMGADKGNLKLYVNNTLIDEFNLGNAFIEDYRSYEDGQLDGKYGLVEFGAEEDVGKYSDDGIRDSENGLLTIMFISKFKQYVDWQYGKVRINIVPELLQSGYNEIYLTHSYLTTINRTEVYKFFYDDSMNHPVVSDTDINQSFISSNKYLSGVRYYSINDKFNISFNALNLFDNTYLEEPIDINFSGIEQFSININSGNLTGISSIPAIGDVAEYSGNITLDYYNVYNIDAIMDITLKNPFDEFSFSTDSKNILINTFINISSDREEHFYDEIYRLPLSDYNSVPSSITGLWNSNEMLMTQDALLFDGRLQYANLNFNDFLPVQSIDYSTYTDDQYYIRAFRDSIPHNNGKILLEGINKDLLLSKKIIIDIKLPSQTGWLSLNEKYDPSTFEGEDGDGCLVDIEDSYFYYTSGVYSTIYSDKIIIMRIKLTTDSPSINKISIWENNEI